MSMFSRPRRRFLVALPLTGLLVAGLTGALSGAEGDVPRGTPQEVGLSAKRLTRINGMVQRAIDAESISGAVTLVARKGKIAHFEARGVMDIESGTAMRTDTIFPIASMTKPVTGVAILMLVEEGTVRLSDPVSRFIPELADPQMAVWQGDSSRRARGADTPEPYTIPASREITIRDLMTHTSGLGSGGAGTRATQRVAPRNRTDTLATYVTDLGDAPLDFHPGTHWAYSGLAGIDTLGRVVEMVSGLTFDEFLRQRIFEPLGMEDTAFVPAAASRDRIVTLYGRTADGLERREVPGWVNTTTLFSGAAVSGRPPRTTCSSRRCCSTRASWAGCGSSDRGRWSAWPRTTSVICIPRPGPPAGGRVWGLVSRCAWWTTRSSPGTRSRPAASAGAARSAPRSGSIPKRI